MNVLIDTWWNVNVFKTLRSEIRCLCFNRYMVECEYYDIRYNTNRTDAVLIDTWWNVNIVSLKPAATWVGVLIDTWWNVN